MASFATSYIPTTTSAATRSADVCSLSGSNFSSWYRQDEGTILSAAQLTVPRKSTRFCAPISFDDGSTGNRIVNVLNSDASNNYVGMFVAASGSTSANAVTTKADTGPSSFVQALSYATNSFAYAEGGGAPVVDTSGGVPVVTQAQIGAGSGLLTLTGHIRRLTYWPARLSNNVLQELTR